MFRMVGVELGTSDNLSKETTDTEKCLPFTFHSEIRICHSLQSLLHELTHAFFTIGVRDDVGASWLYDRG